jgi:mevalonate kinase
VENHNQYNQVYSVPAKVFLLGEYLVLQKGPALVATVAPRFKLKVTDENRNHLNPICELPSTHPVSKLKDWMDSKNGSQFNFKFEDPFDGKGGFGASSALFGLVYYAHSVSQGSSLGAKKDWQDAWNLYREFNFDRDVPPSGADLVAQWNGGVVWVNLDSENLNSSGAVKNTVKKMDWSKMLVFSATDIEGRKTATHDHLDSELLWNKIEKIRPELFKIVEEAKLHLETGDSNHFGPLLTEYAEILNKAGLECREAQEDREVISKLNGVLGVKGCGAKLSDGMIVLMDNDASSAQMDDVIDCAKQRGLTLICTGLEDQKGILLEGAC